MSIQCGSKKQTPVMCSNIYHKPNSILTIFGTELSFNLHLSALAILQQLLKTENWLTFSSGKPEQWIACNNNLTKHSVRLSQEINIKILTENVLHQVLQQVFKFVVYMATGPETFLHSLQLGLSAEGQTRLQLIHVIRWLLLYTLPCRFTGNSLYEKLLLLLGRICWNYQNCWN